MCFYILRERNHSEENRDKQSYNACLALPLTHVWPLSRHWGRAPSARDNPGHLPQALLRSTPRRNLSLRNEDREAHKHSLARLFYKACQGKRCKCFSKASKLAKQQILGEKGWNDAVKLKCKLMWWITLASQWQHIWCYRNCLLVPQKRQSVLQSVSVLGGRHE